MVELHINSLAATAEAARPINADMRLRVETAIEPDFPVMRVPEDHPVVMLAEKAAGGLGRVMKTKTGGGGSDANIFFEAGIVMGILGTGMTDVHSVRESIRLDDMVKSTELLVEIIQRHCGEALG